MATLQTFQLQLTSESMELSDTRRPVSRGWWVAFFSCLILGMVATLPPFLPEAAREVIMGGFSAVCHQLPSRSYHVNGISLAVCHRCMGIYYATAAGAIIFLLMRNRPRILSSKAGAIIVASLIPLGIDWLIDVIGWWSNTPYSRFATGALFGSAAGIYYTKALVELFQKRSQPADESTEMAAIDVNVDAL